MVNHKSGKWGRNLHFQENHTNLQTHAFQWGNLRHSATRDNILRRWGRLAQNWDISSGSCQIECQTPGKFQWLVLLLVTMLVLRYFSWLKTIFHMYIKWLITFLMTQKPSVLKVYKMVTMVVVRCFGLLKIFPLTQSHKKNHKVSWARMYGEGRPGRHVTPQYYYSLVVKKKQNL